MTLENSKRICSLRLLNNNDSYELKIKWKKENKTAKDNWTTNDIF
jgi:hypothetical protein